MHISGTDPWSCQGHWRCTAVSLPFAQSAPTGSEGPAAPVKISAFQQTLRLPQLVLDTAGSIGLTSSVVHRLSACRAWRRRTLASDFAQVSLSPPKDDCRTVSARSRQQDGTGVVTGSIRLGSTSCSARNLAILIIQRSTPNSKALSPAPTVSRACSRTQVGRSSYYFTVPAGACQAAY